MQRSDADNFDSLLKQVFECFDRKEPSTTAAALWFESLSEFYYEDVQAALRYWLKSKNKAPTIAEITSHLRDRKSVGLERNTVANKTRFENFAPTESGRRVLALIRATLNSKNRDPKKWARDLLAMHAAGQPLLPIQLSLATAAISPRLRVPGEDDA